MRHVKTTLSVLGAITVLVLAGNTIALATTGHSFILGQANSANRTTTLSRTTSGTVLSLHSKSSSNSPLSVNGKGKVANLNADLLDGLDSTVLKTTAFVFTRNVTVASSNETFTVPLPPGKYVVSYSAYMSGAESSTIDCYLQQHSASGSVYSGESRFTAGTAIPGATGTGYIDQSAAGSTTTLHCVTGNAFTTFNDEPIQIVATRISAASGPTPARVAARVAH